MKINKSTPILFVDAIEPCLDHWVKSLGFEVKVEVPHAKSLGFVILAKDSVELMMQTFASAEADLPQVMKALKKKPCALYHEVDDVQAIAEALKGAKIVIGPRETNYGAKEIFVEDDAGFIHGYSQHV